MAALLRPARWTRSVAPGVLRIDWSNPITRGLLLAVRPDAAMDLRQGTRLTPTGTRLRVGPQGGWVRGYGPNLGVSNGDRLVAVMPTATPTLTVGTHYLALGDGDGSVGAIHQRDSGTGSNPFSAVQYLNVSTGALMFGSNAIGTAARFDKGTNGVPHAMVFKGAQASASITAFRNGVPETQLSSAGGPGTAAAAGNTYSVGARSGGTRTWDGWIGLYCEWSRVLTDAEAIEFTLNPYQIFATRPAFNVAALGAGGGFQAAWARGSNTIIVGGAL